MKGIAASPGIVIAKVFKFEKPDIMIDHNTISEKETRAEVQRFNKAKLKTKNQLSDIAKKTLAAMGKEESKIFDAQIMVAEDPMFQQQIEQNINDKRLKAEAALDLAVKTFSAMFESLEDEYMRERAADIKDVGLRILYNLANVEIVSLNHLDAQVVIVAEDLTPSDTAQMDTEKVRGFVTNAGGRTSHTAIMARTLEIPAVVGTKEITSIVKGEETIIVDGIEGVVIVNPTEEELNVFQEKRQAYIEKIKALEKIKQLPAVTRDGRKAQLAANIGTPKDVQGALKSGAEGVGLYRTEFLYMNRTALPTEDEQFEAYKAVAVAMKDRPVIIRTLDIGGDKALSYMNFPKELNPFLGWRAVRMCLDRPDIFKTQLRAILRASDEGNLAIMYPMITGMNEIHRANELLETAKEELREKDTPFDEDIKIGIMIETPAAAVIADQLIEKVDFFSIGTNDLTQYTLAVDRGNEKIAHLYQPLHPAVLHLVKRIIDASHRAGKWTGLCGELAGDERAAILLLGMGLDEFSMSAVSIPKVKKMIRNASFREAQKLVEQVLEMGTAEAVKDCLDRFLKIRGL